jgi:hypothetical protein
MLSDKTLERVSMSYARGYRDGYAARDKRTPANGITAINNDIIGGTIRPFADYDYEQGFSAGANDAQRELESRSMSTWSAEELARYSKITGQTEKTLDAALVKLAAILGGSFGDGHHSDTEMVLEAVRRLEVA